MALDEALLSAAEKSALPEASLRLYTWEPAAASIGVSQKLQEVLNLEACQQEGIDLVRRSSGGGAVLHRDELTYSLIVPVEAPPSLADVNESYRLICGALLQGLARLGLRAEFAPINDLLWEGHKFSGNAQTRKKGLLLQHGTVLLHCDASLMQQVLRQLSVKKPIIGLDEALGRRITVDEAAGALVQGLGEGLGLDYWEDRPSVEELAVAEALAREKYANQDWTFRL
jgi:lipoate-protein ligase A